MQLNDGFRGCIQLLRVSSENCFCHATSMYFLYFFFADLMIITHLHVHCNNASKYFPLKVYLSARIKDDLLGLFFL